MREKKQSQNKDEAKKSLSVTPYSNYKEKVPYRRIFFSALLMLSGEDLRVTAPLNTKIINCSSQGSHVILIILTLYYLHLHWYHTPHSAALHLKWLLNWIIFTMKRLIRCNFVRIYICKYIFFYFVSFIYFSCFLIQYLMRNC